MSHAHQQWRQHAQDQYRDLLVNNPEHLRKMEEGWSWCEMMGGPKDGTYAYFVGSPRWCIMFSDSETEYVSGLTPVHIYVLSNEDNRAVYKYGGCKKP